MKNQLTLEQFLEALQEEMNVIRKRVSKYSKAKKQRLLKAALKAINE
jgi:hypothetical protein